MRTPIWFVLPLMMVLVSSASVNAECGPNLFKSSFSSACLPPYPGEDPDAVEKPMSFVMRQVSIRPETTWIAAEGIITSETPQTFRAFLKSEQIYKENRIEFNSPGGNLASAMELGRIIRSMGNGTTIGRTLLLHNRESSMDVIERRGAVCLSACAYAFLGGEKRYLTGDKQLGVHRFGSKNFQLSGDAAQVASSDVARYLEEMGVDQRLLQLAARTSFEDEIFLIDQSLANELRVVYDPSDRTSRFEIALLNQHVVANTTVYHQGFKYSARLHCIDGFPRFVIWGPSDNFPKIFHNLPKRLALISSGEREFEARIQARKLNNGNAFATLDGRKITDNLMRSGKLNLKMIYPPNWESLTFIDRVTWADMATWFNFSLRVENAKGTVPIVLKECR